ncbi:tripartite tricarboxylate transporter substrate binding protein [Bradyrhizobium sp. LHD-71]|uniref:Bug family tripartite tricarboxylate transporter substrate binding protein n=1 Tax=Bradyrhizobium sp. LHD-71 TaxID=3072141 RepID=UPI00280EF169|nr:tripartite tricarboxylate transporter substrate binding protein [Bradyrhizobium sp. LHD-71]MDQ8732435.1 tripartite tricarboxylate transporter substrate binding protein [Bradyrhizobium sp. LHD-71]
MIKRLFCLLTCVVIGTASPVAAQSYPDKPIRFIVPFTPGGSTDATARIVGEAMSEILGQPLVIENRPGAAATLGIDIVSKSKPDGYTLGVSGVGATAIIPIIDPKLTYHPSRDLDVIAGLNSVYGVVVAAPSLKQNSIKEVLEFARANPEKVTYSTAGVAGPAHLNFEYLQQLAGVKMLHVPFSGDVPAITAVLTGDVSMAVVATASATPFIVDGKLKALAANGPGTERMKLLPDLLSVPEQTGFKDYDPHTWSVLVSARGTPPDVIKILNKAVNEALARPDVREKLEKLGLRPLPGDVQWAQEFVQKQIAEKKRIIDQIGLKRE